LFSKQNRLEAFMAVCTCADAQSGTHSAPPDASTLALRAVDAVSNLRDAQLAFNCFESLLAPAVHRRDGNEDEPYATRGELCALVRLLNEGWSRRMEAVDLSVRSVHEALI
jgi:hypothetical protein